MNQQQIMIKNKLRKRILTFLIVLIIITFFTLSIFLTNSNDNKPNYIPYQSDLQQISLNQFQISNYQEQVNQRFLKQVSKQHLLNKVQKILWLYTQPHSSHKQPYVTKKQAQKIKNSQYLTSQQQQIFNYLNILNTKYFAQKDNYTIKQFNEVNYQNYLSSQGILKIQQVLNSFNKTISNQLNQNQNETHIDQQTINIQKQIKKRLIIYSLIFQNGGVYLDNRATLVQSLDQWIQSIPTSPFININKQYQQSNPYCLAFYNDSLSSMKQNINNQNQIDGRKFIVKYPNIDDYFLACGKRNIFLYKLINSYVDLLINKQTWQGFKTINTNQNIIGLTNLKHIQKQGHIIASHYVLQSQQQKLNDHSSNQSSLAAFNLNLFSINSRLGPHKYVHQLYNKYRKTHLYLFKLTIQQLQIFIGPLKFLFYFNDDFVKLIVQQMMKYQSSKSFIQPSSFVYIYWIRHLIHNHQNNTTKNLWEFIQNYKVVKESLKQQKTKNHPNEQLQTNNQFIQTHSIPQITHNISKPTWQSLQKNVWIIWDNGIQGKSNLIVQLCYQNLKKSAQKSGFIMHTVSKDKIQNYISKQNLDKIKNAIKNASFDLGSQAISDLWRLALIYEHGGIYFDASTFSIDQSLDWITTITQIPQNLIWNRYGQEPDVFVLWNAYYCNPIDWHIDHNQNTRAQWQLSLQSNFIAAIKGNELIKEWFQVMLEWITLPFQQIEKQMKLVGMHQFRWTSDNFWHHERYLTVMDSIKYVLGRRQQLLQKQKYIKLYQNSGDYYKLWSMPGQFLCQQKLRGQTNYQNHDYRYDNAHKQIDNLYKYQYPIEEIQKVLGPLQFQGKFFNWQLIMMNKMLNDFYEQNRQNFTINKLNKIIHPQSIIGKKLLNKYPEKTAQLLEHYYQMSNIKVKLKGLNKIWPY